MIQLPLKRPMKLTYRIYDFFTKRAEECGGVYPAKELCEYFDVDERTLRRHIHFINEQTTNGSFEKIIASNSYGYYLLSAEEAQEYLQKSWRLAITYIEKARAIEKKLALDGQTKLMLGDYYSKIYESTI